MHALTIEDIQGFLSKVWFCGAQFRLVQPHWQFGSQTWALMMTIRVIDAQDRGPGVEGSFPLVKLANPVYFTPETLDALTPDTLQWIVRRTVHQAVLHEVDELLTFGSTRPFNPHRPLTRELFPKGE